jgi:hypothetical protein
MVTMGLNEILDVVLALSTEEEVDSLAYSSDPPELFDPYEDDDF